MIKKRIIPLILIKNDNLIYKGTNFNCWRSVGNFINILSIYNKREIDELLLIDISATENNRLIDHNIVKHAAANFNMPLTVGGGIKSIDDASKLFRFGADRLCINSSSYENPKLIKQICEKFGRQALIVSIDYKKIDNEYYCFSNNCKINTNIKVLDWINEIKKYGCGEILLTSYEKEGLLRGMDIEFLMKNHKELDLSVIFGGGAGTPSHIIDALKFKNVNAVSIGSLLPFTRYTPNEIKKECHKQNIKIRLNKIKN